jgi:hypothetical protein
VIDRRDVLRIGGLVTVGGAMGIGHTAPALAGARTEVATTEENLLPNPGLEEIVDGKPAQWRPWNGPSQELVHSSTEHIHGGAYSVRPDDPDSVGPGLRSAMVPVTAGVSYQASAFAYVVKGATQVLLEFWDSSSRRIAVSVGTSSALETWEWLSVEAKAPADATHATVLFYCPSSNVGTAYLDDAALEVVRWKLSIWGGDYLLRRRTSDSLTVQVAALNDPLAFDRVAAFGTVLSFRNEHHMTSPSGEDARWEASGGFRWDAEQKAITIGAGESGSLTVTQIRFQPPPREAFARIAVHERNGDKEHDIWVAAGGFAAPDHAAERELAPDAVAAARKASDYLESRRTPEGGVLISHSTWAGDPQPDPHGNASVATGNLRLWQVTGEDRYRDRAIATLDWLAEVQQDGGGFGFPWAWGGDRGHFAYAGHYPENGATHPVGTVYAIITSNAAQALLEGFEALDRSAYRVAALRAADYLLHDPNGFQWLDEAHTRGSIPYCTMDPVDADGGRSTNIHNIDGASLGLLTELHRLTGDRELRTYADALARNLLAHIEPDASIAYGWHNPTYKPTGYAQICYSGLLTWGRARGVAPWVQRACDGLTWMANVDQPSLLLWEPEAEALGGADNTNAVIGYLEGKVASQHADGSWTGGVNTRTDASGLAVIAALLKQMEFQT